jgi:hypothetical protein
LPTTIKKKSLGDGCRVGVPVRKQCSVIVARQLSGQPQSCSGRVGDQIEQCPVRVDHASDRCVHLSPPLDLRQLHADTTVGHFSALVAREALVTLAALTSALAIRALG